MVTIGSLHVLQGQDYGLPGTVASLATFVGLAMYLAGAGVARKWRDFFMSSPATVFLAMEGLSLATVGLLALGVVTVNARTLPWWGGVAPISGNPLIGFFLAIWLGGLLGVPWLVVGYAVFRAGARETQQPSRVW